MKVLLQILTTNDRRYKEILLIGYEYHFIMECGYLKELKLTSICLPRHQNPH